MVDALTRLRIAHHESGHAVIARAVGLKVRGVRISANGGVVRTRSKGDSQAFEEMVFLFAGMEADIRFLTRNGYSTGRARRMAKPHAGHDLAQARALSKRLGLSQGSAQRRARSLVASRWGAIERMARAHTPSRAWKELA